MPIACPHGADIPLRFSLRKRALDQVVLHRIAGGRGSSGRLDFVKDRGHVGVHGARADDQLLGDLPSGQSLCYQAQHLDFAGCQSSRVGSR